MPLIACLHTAGSNIAVFDGALAVSGLAAGGVRLRHHVRPGLLRATEAAGVLTPEIARQVREVLRDLARDADAVLLTCSSLGPAVEGIAADAPVLRVDAALATEAVRGGGRVVVLCAVPATLEPTARLFRAAAQATGATIVAQLVPGAWDLFTSGDRDGYLRMVAQAADDAADDATGDATGDAAGTGVTVVLAQASMAGAATMAACRPLAGPGVGLRAAAQAAELR